MGEVDLNAQDISVGGDVTGRDKTVTAGGDVVGRDKLQIHVEAGATVIVGERPSFEPEDLSPLPGEPPYKGLQYFDEPDADLFFGRESLTTELVRRLRQGRFLAVVGASGSGKSSVVRAGLVPAIRHGRELVDGTLPPDGCTRWPVHIST